MSLRFFLGMIASSLQLRRMRAGQRRAERALRRSGLCVVVDFERGLVVPESGSVFSSRSVARAVADRLHLKTGRVHVVALVVDAVPLALFEQLAFGSPETSS